MELAFWSRYSSDYSLIQQVLWYTCMLFCKSKPLNTVAMKSHWILCGTLKSSAACLLIQVLKSFYLFQNLQRRQDIYFRAIVLANVDKLFLFFLRNSSLSRVFLFAIVLWLYFYLHLPTLLIGLMIEFLRIFLSLNKNNLYNQRIK